MKTLEALLKKITKKKEQLDSLRPLPKALFNNLNDWFRIESTYASNAIEGNTLTSSETALVVEKGITIAGKTVKEHLEAINHAHAFDYILDLAKKNKNEITLLTILDIHRLILRKIDDEHAGRFRTIQVKIAGSDLKLPDPLKVPELMEDFIEWLHATEDYAVLIAANAHLKLVTIHPFVDGNGRTARLLMNLLLIQEGYPIAIIKPEHRKEYIDALQQAQQYEDTVPFFILIGQAVERSLDMYLEQARVST